jgi:imidazolonepropionase-like amidohydrolase
MEAVDGIPENLALLYQAGACVMAHSDSGVFVQMLNLEVARMVAAGRRMGIDIPDAVAWEFLSYNPAKALGIADRTGSLRSGKMADIVLWNGNPFSSYSRPEKVWIDGALLYDMLDPKRHPIADFELGNLGEDTK